MPEDLASLVQAMRHAVPRSPQPPPFAPAAQQHADDWHADVARARRAHDDAARIARRALVDAQRARYGTDARALLHLPAASPPRRRWDVVVPSGGMRALAPSVADGPGATGGGCTVHASVTGAGVGDSPAVIRLHGGAFWMGGGDLRHEVDRDLVDHVVERLGAVVIDVDHRLAPEHPMPAAFEDVLATLDAVRDASTELGIDPDRIALLGTSSGGSIAMAAAILDARRGRTHPLAALACIVPSFDLASVPPAMAADAAAMEARQRMLRGYLGEHDVTGVWASPARAEHLDGLPPTFVAVAAHDEIALGGAAACDAIVRGGGRALARRYPATHTVAAPQAEAAIAIDVGDFLAEHLVPA